MICRRLVLCSIFMALLGTAACSHADETTEITDKSGVCTVKADSDWKRMSKLEAEKDSRCLILEFTGKGVGKLIPNFMILTVATDKSLAIEAQGLVDSAKKKVADQGDYGTITDGKVDGEDAKIVTTRTTITQKPALRKDIVVRHNGKFYIIEFFCSDDQYANLLPIADALFDSFHWK